jgi:DNA-binding response OmpR family regulator
MYMRVLLIEDDRDLSRVLKKGLEEEGYSVDVSYDGVDGLYMAGEIAYDAIILDVMLPGLDGVSVLSELRRKGVLTPIMMLTARGRLDDKVRGLDSGADDYLTKPFEFDELLARLRALIRRRRPVGSSVLRIHDLEIDTARKEVKRDGRPIGLTPKEYALLEYLAFNKNTALSRRQITEHIYDESFDLDSNIIDVFINNLRRKIDRDHPKKLIHTVRGYGYMLRE